MTAYRYRVSQQLTFKPRELTYDEAHPVNFYTFYSDITDTGSNEVTKTKNTLYYDGSYTPKPLILRVYNQLYSSSPNAVTVNLTSRNNPETPTADNYHFCLRFLNGVLTSTSITDQKEKIITLTGHRDKNDPKDSEDAPKDGEDYKWLAKVQANSERYIDIYFLKKTKASLSPQATPQGSYGISIDLSLLNLYIDLNHPEDNSLVSLIYGPLMYDTHNSVLKSSDNSYYSVKQKIIFQHRIGQQKIPLHVGFVGSNTILNDGEPYGSESERIEQIAIQGAAFKLVPETHPDKVLGVYLDHARSECPLQLQDLSGAENEDGRQWLLQIGHFVGSYKIRLKKPSNKGQHYVIDLWKKAIAENQDLKIYENHDQYDPDSFNQEWQLIPVNGKPNFFQIISSYSTRNQKEVSIAVDNNDKVKTEFSKQGANQQNWKLELVDKKSLIPKRNTLRLRIVNTLAANPLLPKQSQLKLSKHSRFIISFDHDSSNDGTNRKEWMLGNRNQIKEILITLLDHDDNKVSDNWSISKPKGSLETIIQPKKDNEHNNKDIIFEPEQGLEIELSKIITDYPTGTTNMYIRYENIPGYWDGQFVIPIEKTPLVYRQDSIAMGTTSPEAFLHIRANHKLHNNLAVFEASPLGDESKEIDVNPVTIRGFRGKNNAFRVSNNKTEYPAVSIENEGSGASLEVKNNGAGSAMDIVGDVHIKGSLYINGVEVKVIKEEKSG